MFKKILYFLVLLLGMLHLLFLLILGVYMLCHIFKMIYHMCGDVNDTTTYMTIFLLLTVITPNMILWSLKKLKL
jgi:hypothetical protein